MVVPMWIKWLLAAVLLGLTVTVDAAESQARSKDDAVERLIQRYTAEGRKPDEIVKLVVARFPSRVSEVVEHVAKRWPSEFKGIYSAAMAAGASDEDVIEGAVRGGVSTQLIRDEVDQRGVPRSRALVGAVRGGADFASEARDAIGTHMPPAAVVQAGIEAGLGRDAVAKAAMAAGIDSTDVIAGFVEAGEDVAAATRDVILLDRQRARDVLTTAVTVAPGAATKAAESAMADGMSEADVSAALAVGVLLSDPEAELQAAPKGKTTAGETTPRFRPAEPVLTPASTAGQPASGS